MVDGNNFCDRHDNCSLANKYAREHGFPMPLHFRSLEPRTACPVPVPKYRYRLRSTDASSSKFGPCEICGKHATEVFRQTEELEYDDEESETGKGWTQYECRSAFGHESCLIGIRR